MPISIGSIHLRSAGALSAERAQSEDRCPPCDSRGSASITAIPGNTRRANPQVDEPARSGSGIRGSERLIRATQGRRPLARWPPAYRLTSAVYSGGHGAKGGRLYDWAQVELAALAAPGMARWLLVRRRHGELAFYACSGPVSTSLVGLVRVAGMRWPVEEDFQQAKTRSTWTAPNSC